MSIRNLLDSSDPYHIIFFKLFSVQSKYKLEAMRGMGVDRHLFGLYVVAKGLKLDPMPSLFY